MVREGGGKVTPFFVYNKYDKLFSYYVVVIHTDLRYKVCKARHNELMRNFNLLASMTGKWEL